MAAPNASPIVRFVVVPFLPAHQPALGISSLLSVLGESGIEGDARYLNLDYGERIGWDLVKYLTGQLPTSFLPGEMLFSRALWGDRAPAFESYERRIIRWLGGQAKAGGAGWNLPRRQWEGFVEQIRVAVEEAPAVVEAWADAILVDRPRVLGFTSTFQQSLAALALAQEVRRRVPSEEVAIFFGGANCEDDMGRALADNFDFIDCVVSGEAEEVIVDLVRWHADGVGDAPQRFVQGALVRDMDKLPLPDFDDYFKAVTRPAFADLSVRLTAESSRGCWWGAKSHCTFCGLNGGGMAFRGKSAPRFATELETLSQKYGFRRFSLTDNIIDMSYLRTLLPELVAQARKYKLFYETKSNLRKDQLELMAAAGISVLQPGIESFSTSILKLMAKGTTRLQNVQLLKWCGELGVGVVWNLLYGFPGEEPEEYREMADLLPALFHFTPPVGCGRIRLDRFGPYWKWPERYGICDVRRYWSYDFVYGGLPEAERERLAYYFEYQHEDGRNPLDYASQLVERVNEWHSLDSDEILLELRTSPSGATLVDTRPCGSDGNYVLTPAELALLRALDGFRGRDSLSKAIRDQGVVINDRELDRLLEDFVARRYVIEETGRFLSVVMDPAQRQRVAERQVALRVGRLGFTWPDDFPDPAKQQVVRAAMLAMGA